MPSIATQTKRLQEAIDAGALQPSVAESVKLPIPVADYPVSINSYSRGPLPASSVQQPDMQRGWQTGATPQVRLTPISPTSDPVTGAQAASQAIQIVKNGSGPLFETNNSPNANQSILNLIAGSNISLTANSQGGVTITGTASGDGLVHGDTIWEIDPAYVLLRDDFVNGNTSSGQIGELGWFSSSTGSPTLNAQQTGDVFPSVGMFAISTDTTAATGGSLELNIPTSSNSAGHWPLLDYPGWKLIWTFKFQRSGTPTTGVVAFTPAKMSFYAGLANTMSLTGTGRPDNFIGVRCDTDTTAPSIADTTFWLEAVFNVTNSAGRVNTQGTSGGVFNTGITPQENIMYRLEITSIAVGTVKISLFGNNQTATTTITCVPTTVSAVSPNASVTVLNGLANLQFTSATNPEGQAFGVGTKAKFALSGGTGSISDAVLYNSAVLSWTTAGSGTNGSPNTASISAFPALLPYATMANDSQATPVAKTGVFDFFSFVWNPGVSGSTIPPNSGDARYF